MGRKSEEVLFNRHGVSVWDNDKDLEMGSDNSCIAMWMHSMLWGYAFQNGQNGKAYVIYILPY